MAVRGPGFGGSQNYSLAATPRALKSWSDAGFKVSSVPKNDSVLQKVSLFFKGLGAVRVEAEGECFFLKPNSDLGRELLKAYRKGGRAEMEKAAEVLTNRGAAIELLKNGAGKDSALRRAAAEMLIGKEEQYESREGILIIRGEHKTGEVKLQVFHLNSKVQIGAGANNKIFKVREEVFGKHYKDKSAVVREGNNFFSSDVPTFELAKELNDGKMPEGFQKFPKVPGGRLQVIKLYSEGSMTDWITKGGVPIKAAFEAMGGAMNGLVSCKKLGIAHVDLKLQNFFVSKKKNEKPRAVFADFDCAHVFPDFNKVDAKMAEKMLKVIGHGHIMYSSGDPAEIEAYTKLLGKVMNGLQLRAAGKPDPKGFESNYQQLKGCVEKIQVMQMGLAMGEVLLGNEFTEYAKAIQDGQEGNLSALIDKKFGPNHPAKQEMIALLEGMLESDPTKRFTAEQAMDAYNAALAKWR